MNIFPVHIYYYTLTQEYWKPPQLCFSHSEVADERIKHTFVQILYLDHKVF